MGELIAISILIVVATYIKKDAIKESDALNSIYNYGVFVRVLGTGIYLIYAYNFSGGSVDAFVYDNYAAEFAKYFMQFDLSPFTNEKLWRGGEFFYTNFVAYPAAIFMILTFASDFGIYLLFSLICFIGLVSTFYAFRKNYVFLHQRKILTWLLMFPALWFWTSTIGKDAFMFLGIGLTCLGITNYKLNYFLIAFGVFVLYAFRPPAAYIALLALGSFFVINVNDTPLLRLVKIAIGIFLIINLLNYLSDKWGVEDFTNESLTELQSGTLRYNNYGTAALEEKGGGITSIPRGILDVLARPFIWESGSLLTFASALEINSVLLLLWIRRRSVKLFFKNGLKHRLSTFVLSFVLIYVVSVGLFENNIGLIARHRSIIFPFLFLMAFAYDETVQGAYINLIKRKKMINE